MSMPEITYRTIRIMAGDAVTINAGRLDDPDAAVALATARMQVRQKDGTLVRDLTANDEVTCEADGEGGFLIRGDVAGADTADWPVGVVYCDLEVVGDGQGPYTVQRTTIHVSRSTTL